MMITIDSNLLKTAPIVLLLELLHNKFGSTYLVGRTTNSILHTGLLPAWAHVDREQEVKRGLIWS